MSKDPASADVEVSSSKLPFRPDLTQSMSSRNDDERILSTLGAPHFVSGSNAKKPKKLFFAAAMLSLATLAAAVAGYSYFHFANQESNTPRSFDISKNKPAANITSTEPGIKETVVIAESTPAAPSASAMPAAQIVNEAPPLKPAAESMRGQLTDALEKDVKPPKAAIQKALESKPGSVDKKSSAAAPKATVLKSDAKTASKTSVKNGTATTIQASAKTNASNNKGSGKADTNLALKAGTNGASSNAIAAKNSGPGGDKDINLIAALLTHNAATQANTLPSGVKSAAVDTTTSAKANNAGLSPSAGKSLLPARAESTESRLKQCEGLDLLQREICKLKTCNNLWDTDASCKATLSSAK